VCLYQLYDGRERVLFDLESLPGLHVGHHYDVVRFEVVAAEGGDCLMLLQLEGGGGELSGLALLVRYEGGGGKGTLSQQFVGK
jgi:hypothetical protein